MESTVDDNCRCGSYCYMHRTESTSVVADTFDNCSDIGHIDILAAVLA